MSFSIKKNSETMSFISKVFKHFKNNTLLSSIKKSGMNYILSLFGFYFFRNLFRKILKRKREHFDIPNSTCDFDFPRFTKTCLVYGSAPDAIIPVGYNPNWTLVTANSSQFISDKFGMKSPDLSIVCSTTFLHKSSRYDIEYNIGALQVLRGRSTGNLIIAEDKFCTEFKRKLRNQEIKESLNRNNYKYNLLNFLSYPYRYKLTARILDDDFFIRNVVSTGLFTALFAFFCGAPKVVMSGFSFSNHKHAYPDDFFNRPGGRGEQGRGEVNADQVAINIIIAKKFPIFAAERIFSEESGLTHWNPSVD